MEKGKRSNVVISAATLHGNKGAQAMAMAILEGISRDRPDVQFHLASYYHRQDRQYPKPSNLDIIPASPFTLAAPAFLLGLFDWLMLKLRLPFRLAGLHPYNRRLRNCSLFIDAAGVSFSDGREKFLIFNVLSILPALLYNRPAVKCAQALGPFEGRINRWTARIILPKLDRIFARGGDSYKFCTEMGLDNVTRSADVAFVLSPERHPEGCLKKERTRKTVALSPSGLVYRKCQKKGLDYPGTLAGLATHLIKVKGCEVVLIPHSIRPETTKPRNNDLPVCQDIYELCGGMEGLSIIKEELSAGQLKGLIGGCDFLVTSRFHAMIAALSTRVPVLVLGWGHKYLEVLDDFGLTEWVLDYRQATIQELVGYIDRLFDQEETIKRRLSDKLPGVTSRAGEQIEYFKRVLQQ